MNILFHIPEMTQEAGGVRQYAISLLKTLANDTANKYFVYHNAEDPEVLRTIDTHEHLSLVRDSDLKNVWLNRQVNKVKRLANFIYRAAKLRVQLDFVHPIDIIAARYNINIIHCPFQYLPHCKRVKLITTLHDVQEIHYPEYFPAETRAYRATFFLDFVRRAHKVIVSFEHVKKDLIKYFGVPAENIAVVLLDMDMLWLDDYKDKQLAALEQFRLPPRFVLYPANTWPHKNHIRLLRSIAHIRDTKNVEVSLVCTGHQNDDFENITAELQNLQLNNQVTFLGIVQEKILYSLYKKCCGVVVPTTYEAGSFPLIESMLLEVPVICSNVTSLPETVQDERFLFDPISIEDMADKILRLWSDDDFRKSSVENSMRVAPKLRKSGALEKFTHVYEELVA